MAKCMMPLAVGILLSVCLRKVLNEAQYNEKIVIVGGGTAGIGMAAQLLRCGFKDITIIEPADTHYYQSAWTLVGAGCKTKESTVVPMKNMMPSGVVWIREAVVTFLPESNEVQTTSGKKIAYAYLIVAAGLQINWSQIPGLAESIGKPGSGVVSNYGYDYAAATWEAISSFSGKRAFFTLPNTPIKCAGAPQKILWLFEDHLRKVGKREGVDIRYWTPGDSMLCVPRYSEILGGRCQVKGVCLEKGTELVGIDAAKKIATFKSLSDGKLREEPFDLLHVTPPMSAPDFVAKSPLAGPDGWVAADQYTLQHPKYPNVFALGDCAGLPTCKTAAGVSLQVPVVVHNLRQAIEGKPLDGSYSGYSSCPITLEYGQVMLAEVGYGGALMETFQSGTGIFPLTLLGQHGSLQYRLFWLLKKYIFPMAYWYLWPQGLWYGPHGIFRPDTTKSVLPKAGASGKSCCAGGTKSCA